MANWQDLVLTIGSLIFVIALIPSVKGRDKPTFWTSALTGSVLVTFVIVYATLDLWFAAGVIR